ncbi:cytochrome P450 89A2-like isoform X2 [Durio zibethinus]|uniref:Cytochrome P450 89A2-like isoform X2 n=1 Tax=Durio zibethinus TaxID=66656 RepID=A0A6P5Z0P6_DURZI|nr:cytochrome P450 89A2-like isoform X2 [Durio zibethinus]
MEPWFIILISICISAFIKFIFNLLFTTRKPSHNLPPGPSTYPIICSSIWLRNWKSFSELEPILRGLHAKLGNIVTLRIGSYPAIFISDHSLAHQALVQNGAVFADRPSPVSTAKIDSSNQHTINSASYGPTWRILRNNLTSEILNPSRVRSYSHARKWTLNVLKEQLIKSRSSGEPVTVVDHFRYAMFCLLALMCFGDKLDEKQIKRIEDVQLDMLLNFGGFNILNVWPRYTKVLFHKFWKKFLRIRQNQEDILIPLIRAREKAKQENLSKVKDEFVLSYVDTLLELQLPEDKRKLNEGEMVSLCSEFLNAGTDTTSTVLQWIMANLVKYPHIQEKLFMEIKGVVGEGEEEVKEDDLQKMPYLKAVVLESLRRHPPAHFLLPHKVTRDVVFNDFLFPRRGMINFMVAEMGLDPEVWEDPMAFKPERFLNSDGSEELFDITGSKEIKMMPFGAGRRICPGIGLAMLHLEFFVANLVWSCDWKAVDGDDVDLSEKQEFTMVMKTPLQAHLYSRPR